MYTTEYKDKLDLLGMNLGDPEDLLALSLGKAFLHVTTECIIRKVDSMAYLDYGGCDYGECDYGELYGECDYGECEYGE